MREVTLEIPLLESPLSDEPDFRPLADLLKHARPTYLFRIRGEGFVVTCRVPSRQSEEFRKSSPANRSRRIHVRVLRKEKSGNEVLQISGAWRALVKGGDSRARKIVQFMKSAKRKRIYITKNPSFDGRKLRVSLAADGRTITGLLGEMKHAGIPFEVASLGSSRAREESPLGDLTARQAEVLRLAHSMGYYDVPKKVGIEDIAHMLGKDKGTVGEHLRRAEKHVFDQLLT